MSNQHLEKALLDFSKAIELDPDEPDFRYNFFTILARSLSYLCRCTVMDREDKEVSRQL